MRSPLEAGAWGPPATGAIPRHTARGATRPAPITRKKVLLFVVPLEVVAALLARRDLARRPDVAVRGSKRFGRVFVLLNPGNALVYWLVGRRRVTA